VQVYTPPKEQVPKRPLEQISQVDGTTIGRNSGERIYVATKGEGSTKGLKLSGKRTEKGRRKLSATLFCPFLRAKKQVSVVANTTNKGETG
jgi:hypothetical protein